RYACFTPWQHAPESYGASSPGEGHGRCERQVLAMLDDILRNRMQYAARDGEAWLDAARNASLVAAAERYYRALYRGSTESWNLRDRHMFDTLCAVLDSRGPDAKAVVWAHNSHLGDARATEMGRWGELNLGQLCRERFGNEARLVGFGTDRGTVAAAHEWGDPMQVMDVRPALPESVEGLCRETGLERFRLDLRVGEDHGAAREFLEPRLERAIGVIYRPMTERQSHYFETVLSRQFDHYVWFTETRAVTPLPGAESGELAEEETWPFGV
ncbi:MAG TPA: erythromycin esterase family protein, partial [Arenibaculum sp.]|nr:erythromycin esterase family protein [Arenibaculum sp.]